MYALNATRFSRVNKRLSIQPAKWKNSAIGLVVADKSDTGMMLSSKRALASSVLFYFYLALALPSPLSAAQCPPVRIDDTEQVQHVYDGDTVKLRDGRRVRLIGINAPEIGRDGQPSQPYAQRARRELISLLEQSDFRIGLQFETERFDKYQRTLAHLYGKDNRSISEALLKQGMVVAFATPPNAAFSDCYRQHEEQAQNRKLGIWSHREYRTINSRELSSKTLGFRIIEGEVTDVRTSRKRITLKLPDALDINIYRSDLDNFRTFDPATLKGKQIRVRGWVHKNKGRYRLKLRHPSALELLP